MQGLELNHMHCAAGAAAAAAAAAEVGFRQLPRVWPVDAACAIHVLIVPGQLLSFLSPCHTTCLHGASRVP